MKRRLLAALVGMGAGLLLVGAYFAALYYRVPLRPDMVVAAAAAFVFAAAVAIFALVAMDRPAFRRVRQAIVLNEELAKEFIYYFRAPKTLQIVARPDMSVGEMLVRFGDEFKSPSGQTGSPITITLKGSTKKPFAAVTLQRLFAVLPPHDLQHVVLLNDKDDFVGYIPGKRAAKEFTGDKAIEAIDKFIVKILMNPSESAVLRDLGGVTSDDTIAESKNSFQAQEMLWANDKIQGLIVHRKLKPVGFISKVDILRINAGLP